MNAKAIPDGMISAASFATKMRIDEKEVIQRVRDGCYSGQIIDGSWYVGREELAGAGVSSNKKSLRISTPALSKFFFMLAALSFIGGMILCAEFWPGELGYGDEWASKAYIMSITWLMLGVLEGALFAAIGQGLAYLNQITINTAEKT